MLGLLLASSLIPGVQITGIGSFILAALLLGLVNAFVRPIAFLLTLPLSIVTLGLFLFVINAAMFGLVAWLLDGFMVAGFWPAMFGAIIVSLTGTIAPRLFCAGEGIPENDAEAVKWYLLAAEQGNSIAQNNLGAMYFAGEGIEENQVEAYKWFFISGELGNDDGRGNSEFAGESMMSGEILKAKMLGRQWLAEFENSGTID